MNFFGQVTLKLLEHFAANCQLFFVTLVFALPLGLLITFGSMSKWRPFECYAASDNKFLKALSEIRPISFLTKSFVWIIRGTPLMLQLMVVWYVPSLVFGINLGSRMLSAMVAFIINYAAYFSEIYRGGIESIPQGQYEAGEVLGLTKGQTFRKVVLMQVVKRVVPPIGNEVMTLIKDTSLANTIAVAEIYTQTSRYAGRGIIWPMFYTGVFFLVFCLGLTLLFNYIEKKLDYYKG